MSTQILATKLYIPPPPPKAVQRPRLIERLNEGLSRRLTLIAAPAGFGKTTLVSEWVAGLHGCGRHVAWLSLDEGDSDPARFLSYLAMGLQRIAPTIGQSVGGLQSPEPPAWESSLTSLLNEIASLPEVRDKFIVVLDDYHVIDATARVPGASQGVDQALAFLLEHMPPQMHLVIATREDPQIPLARLRGRGQLTELRAADLRFTPVEAAEFLNQVMGLSLTAEDVALLETRTEGWIAGLQLAALSVQGHADVTGFIKSFAGDNRYIVDYLAEEVLQSQPESVRSFLLQTSILDLLNGPLCDAVTGQQEGSGQARLEALERGNFFVVPLDDKRHWYRYHHLFAEVLHAHLVAETARQPDQVLTLHRLASKWYEQYGSAADAIRHALAARDFERAADLIELEWQAMRRSRQEAPVLGWLKALPDEVIRLRPVLSVGYAHVLLSGGELAGVEDRLRDAERWLDPPDTPNTLTDMRARPDTGSAAMVVVDEEAFRLLPGQIAVARAGHAFAVGDVAGTVKYARRVLELVPEDDRLGRGAAAGLLGLASWASGDLEAAHRTFAEGMAHLQSAGNIADAISGAITLADIRIAQGRLHEAMRTYERSLELAAEQHEPILRGTADMYVGIGALYCEHNDLDAATEHLLKSKALGEHTGLRQYPFRWCVVMARIREAHGDLDGALDLLGEAERVYVADFSPDVRPVAAMKARVWVAQGTQVKLGEALAWARGRDLSVEDDLSYLREFEHITLARVLMALYKSDREDGSLLEALNLLERLLKAAEEGDRGGSIIEILVLQSLAYRMQGDIPAALVPLRRVLTLAEPEGYVRMFVDEGPPMAQLLLEAAARGIMPEYTGKLMQAFVSEQPQGSRPGLGLNSKEFAFRSYPQEPPGRSVGDYPVPASVTSQPLIEPLSYRELEVLRLFQTELTGPEIARELVIALSTLRTHTKGIYSKLNVNSRRAAVKRAAELDLIKPR